MRYLIVLFFLTTCCLSAQNNADTAYLNAENKRAYGMHEEESDSAFSLCMQLLDASRKAGYSKGQGDACLTIGLIYLNNNNFVQSDRYLKESLINRRNVGDSSRVAAVLLNIGVLRCLWGKYDEAIDKVTESIKILETTPDTDKPLLGGAYLELANIFDEYLVPDEALNYARKSLAIYVDIHNNEFVGRAAYFLGNVFYKKNQPDSALYYYNQAYNNFLASSGDKDYLSNILINKGIIYTEKASFQTARTYFDQAEEILKQIGPDADYFHFNLNKADWFIQQEKLQSGLEYLKKVLISGVEDISDRDRQFLYEDLATAYAGINMHDSAYYFQLLANVARDSIFNDNKNKHFIRWQAERYKTESLQDRERAHHEASRAEKLLIIASLFAVIAILLILAYIQRRNSFRIISEQRERLHRQAVDELIQTSETRFLTASIEGGEAARENISKEIHDRLGSAMVTLSWQYDAVLDHFPPESPQYKQMERLNSALKKLYHDIRHIAHQLGAGVLERVGLVPVLQELRDDIAASNKVEVDFSFFGLDRRLSFFQEVNILRIIQELVSNTLKYAAATQLSVEINRLGDDLNLMIEDNGKGFDPTSGNYGIGLSNVENRTRSLGGTMQVESHPGSGTCIILHIPLHKQDQNIADHDQTH